MVQTTESLQLIDYQNVKIMLDQKENISFVLVLKKESTFLRYKLNLFADEFKKFFDETLKEWSGDTQLFNPTKALIEKNFEVDE